MAPHDESTEPGWVRKVRAGTSRPAEVLRESQAAKPQLSPRAANLIGLGYMAGLAVAVVLGVVTHSLWLALGVVVVLTLLTSSLVAARGRPRPGDRPPMED